MMDKQQQLADTATRRLVEVATPILQGLLASGHYTTRAEGERTILRWDAGEDWKDDHAVKWPSNAVDDALDLAKELLKQAKMDVEKEMER